MTQDELEIRAVIDQWMSASRGGDTQAVLSLMTDDVVFMVPGREPFGKEAFAQSSDAMKGVQINGTNEIRELEVLGDWAYLRSYLEVEMLPPKGDRIFRTGYTLTLLRKSSEGRWLLARDANLLTTRNDKNT